MREDMAVWNDNHQFFPMIGSLQIVRELLAVCDELSC
jgi:hypothetical protein